MSVRLPNSACLRPQGLVVTLFTLSLLLLDAAHAQRPYYMAAWGSNYKERLGGFTSGMNQNGPLLVHLQAASSLRPGANLNIKQVAPGAAHAMAVTTDDQVLVWGSNDNCQLGITPCGLPSHFVNLPTWMNPIPTGETPYNILSLLTAGSTSFAHVLTESSLQLYGWGETNATGSNAPLLPQVTDSADHLLSPTAVGLPGEPSFETITVVACSGSLCVANTSNGIIGWGDSYSPFDVFPCATTNQGICNFSAEPSFSTLLGGSAIKKACVATERDEYDVKQGARIVLVTDDNRLLLAGTGMDFSGTVPVTLGWTSIDGSSFHSSCAQIDEVQCGNDFVFVRCNSSVLSFGKNHYLALGIPDDSVVKSVYLPGLVDLELDPLESAIRVAAGKNSGYVLTSEGRVMGWGSMDYCALGNPCNKATSLKRVINLNSVTRNNFIVQDITATSEADGAFVTLAELPVGVCPAVPQTMMARFWCNQEDMYTFLPMELSNGSFSMPSGVGLQGNLTLSGTVDMDMPEGMVMHGLLHVKGNSHLKLGKHSSIVGELVLDESSVTELDGASFCITNGTFEMTSQSKMVLTNVTFSSDGDAQQPLINITAGSSASLSGTLDLVIPEEISSQLIRQANDTQSSRVTMMALVVKSDEPTTETKELYVTITLLQPTDSPCQTFSGSYESTPTTLLVFVALDSSACYPTTPDAIEAGQGAPIPKSQTTTYIIVGAVVGAVIIGAIVTALIILNSQKLKNSLLPFREG